MLGPWHICYEETPHDYPGYDPENGFLTMPNYMILFFDTDADPDGIVGGWWNYGDDTMDDPFTPEQYYPTHWMPMPDPPSTYERCYGEPRCLTQKLKGGVAVPFERPC